MKAGQWTMAMRNLSRNKRRNLATGVAIGLGFAALIALGGFTTRMQNYLRVYTIYATRVGHINIYKENGLERYSTKPKQYSLDEGDIAKIQAAIATMDNVEMHGPQLLGGGLIGNGCRTVPFIAFGIDPQLDLRLRQHPEMVKWAPNLKNFTKGRGLENYPDDMSAIGLSTGLARILGKSAVHDDFAKDQKVVIVTDCTAPDTHQKIAADANVQLVAGSWSGMLTALDGEVVANFESGVTETANSAVLTTLTLLQRLYDTHNATFYSVWLKDPGKLNGSMAELSDKLRAAGLSFELYPWTDEAVAPFYSGVIQFVYTMVSFLTFVLASVVIFSIFNSATMTVIERSQEIGMMRSLGFTRTHIRRLFLMEMLALTLLSVIGGGIAAALGIFGVNHAEIPYNPPGIVSGMHLQLVVTPAVVLSAAALIFLLAAFTTLLAVRSVAKQNISSLLLGAAR